MPQLMPLMWMLSPMVLVFVVVVFIIKFSDKNSVNFMKKSVSYSFGGVNRWYW